MNLEREANAFLGLTTIWVILILVTFGLLNWLHIPAGSLLDWLIGGAMFWWLTVIVTIPWNIYFQAKTVLVDADISQTKGIAVNEQTRQYVQTVQKRALWIAIGLHLLSAIAFYLLALTEISSIGYISSVAALLLTGLRPAIAAYGYLVQRLANIGRELKYPREDIVTLQNRVRTLADQQQALATKLNLDDSTSWAAKQQRLLGDLQQDYADLSAVFKQFKAINHQEHERIEKEAKGAIAQLNEDSRFLEQVREIIRFFKAA